MINVYQRSIGVSSGWAEWKGCRHAYLRETAVRDFLSVWQARPAQEPRHERWLSALGFGTDCSDHDWTKGDWREINKDGVTARERAWTWRKIMPCMSIPKAAATRDCGCGCNVEFARKQSLTASAPAVIMGGRLWYQRQRRDRSCRG